VQPGEALTRAELDETRADAQPLALERAQLLDERAPP